MGGWIKYSIIASRKKDSGDKSDKLYLQSTVVKAVKKYSVEKNRPICFQFL